MIVIEVPFDKCSELNYTIKVIFEHFWKIDYIVRKNKDINCVRVISNLSDKVLLLDCSFFHSIDQNWMSASTIPSDELQWWKPVEYGFSTELLGPELPILFGSPVIERKETELRIEIDILGTIFYMLSRYEEVVITLRDKHNRFKASSSTSYKQGFIQRPIVDEYLEILFESLGFLDSNVNRFLGKGKIQVSCDVDWTYNPAIDSLKSLVLHCARIILLERNLIYPLKLVWLFLISKFGFKARDDFFQNIYWIMEQNEYVGNTVTFYFISKVTSKYDPYTDYSNPSMVRLLNDISERGHTIGLHPGYGSLSSPEMFKQSVVNFRNLVKKIQLNASQIYCRMHFLRWDSLTTPAILSEQDISNDSTLMYAEHSGFRCGTAREYPMYDLKNRKPLKLLQQPLIVMDASLLARRYENLNVREALVRINMLKERSIRFGGNFSILWHNSSLNSKKTRRLYKNAIK